MWTLSKNSQLRNSQRGATSIEYALIAMIISIVVIGGSLAFGVDLSTVFDTVRAVF
jgi:Flp pilus assembly pilin Flp